MWMQGITDYNGGAVLAMIGKGCVAVASDKRLGSNGLKTVETNFEKAFQITPKTMLACAGLASDIQTMHRTLRFHTNLFHLREEREMKPQSVATFVANMLYQRRFGPWYWFFFFFTFTSNPPPGSSTPSSLGWTRKISLTYRRSIFLAQKRTSIVSLPREQLPSNFWVRVKHCGGQIWWVQFFLIVWVKSFEDKSVVYMSVLEFRFLTRCAYFYSVVNFSRLSVIMCI